MLGDIAVITVAGVLPVSADLEGRGGPGAPVTAVGFPSGGPLELAEGEVVDEVDGRGFGVAGPVLRVTSELEPGNSGGPLLDARGRVVGVAFAVEVATGLGLALPLDTVDALLDEAVPGCGRS